MKGFTTILVLAAVIIGVVILYPSGSSIGQLPEITITAPRHYDTLADSVGVIPGIDILTERYAPETENTFIRTYENYRSKYHFLFSLLYKYAGLVLLTAFAITLGIIVLVKQVRYYHVHAKKEKSESAFHKYIKSRKKRYHYI